jgi:hypothetical protein
MHRQAEKTPTPDHGSINGYTHGENNGYSHGEKTPISEAAPFTTKLEKLPKARVNGSAYAG